MTTWKIAGVQMDVHLGSGPDNLAVIRSRLRQAAVHGARLVVFPECALSGYCFDSKDEALPHAESLPGPATDAVANDCRELGTWAAFGLLERDGDRLFNSCVLVGPQGQLATYRKVHLPFLGVDRFTTPGDRPFAIHDLGDLRVGINICYDGSFPEASRVLALLGADLVLLPTNWPSGAAVTAKLLPAARAFENSVYYAAVNRSGEERGFRFIGHSRLIDPSGDLLALGGDGEEILYAEVNPERARAKRQIKIPGKYEIDRIGDRRPEMYGLLATRVGAPQAGEDGVV